MKPKKSGAGGRRSRGERASSRAADRKLEDALAAVSQALATLGAPWMLIGGLAVIARGVRRATTDIDVVVKGDKAVVRDVIAILSEHGVEPRIANADAFARENLVLLARHSQTGVDVDLSFAWSSFEHEALLSCEVSKLGRVRLPIARAEDLVVLKIVAGRAKDLADVEALLLMHPEVDRRVVRRRVAELADLAEEPEMLLRLDALFKE